MDEQFNGHTATEINSLPLKKSNPRKLKRTISCLDLTETVAKYTKKQKEKYQLFILIRLVLQRTFGRDIAKIIIRYRSQQKDYKPLYQNIMLDLKKNTEVLYEQLNLEHESYFHYPRYISYNRKPGELIGGLHCDICKHKYAPFVTHYIHNDGGCWEVATGIALYVQQSLGEAIVHPCLPIHLNDFGRATLVRS